MKGYPSESMKIFTKNSHKAEISIKSFGQVRDSNPRPSASQSSKNLDQPLCQVAVEVTNYQATAY